MRRQPRTILRNGDAYAPYDPADGRFAQWLDDDYAYRIACRLFQEWPEGCRIRYEDSVDE